MDPVAEIIRTLLLVGLAGWAATLLLLATAVVLIQVVLFIFDR